MLATAASFTALVPIFRASYIRILLPQQQAAADPENPSLSLGVTFDLSTVALEMEFAVTDASLLATPSCGYLGCALELEPERQKFTRNPKPKSLNPKPHYDP